MGDTVSFKSSTYSWNLAWLPTFGDEQQDCLRKEQFKFAPTATLETQVSSLDSLGECDEEAEVICRLMCLATGVASTWVQRTIHQDGRSIHEEFVRKGLSTAAENKARYETISNLDEPSRLRRFLEDTIDQYLANQNLWRLDQGDFVPRRGAAPEDSRNTAGRRGPCAVRARFRTSSRRRFMASSRGPWSGQ